MTRPEPAGAGRAGAERPGAERPGAERPGAERPGAERPGAERAGAELPDDAGRTAIRRALGETLFVEAGAGSGKTSALVGRIVALALDPGRPVPLRTIAAITFTEKAAAELRDRLRTALEKERGAGHPAAAEDALNQLDEAPIGTVHAFARRILTEHPIEAGLPPLIEVLDEVASSVAFEHRWTVLRADLLDEPALTTPLLSAMAVGLRLEDLRSIARAFNSDWDLIEPRVLSQQLIALPAVDCAPLIERARTLCAQSRHCTDPEDNFLRHLAALGAWAAGAGRAADDPDRLAALHALGALKCGRGRQGNWTACGLPRLKTEFQQIQGEAAALCAAACDAALRHIAQWIGGAVLAAARARRTDGALEFHDLLVLTRDLLRSPVHGPSVRRTLSERYQRILLDEFQDTDPIQIELAVRIAGGTAAAAPDWADVAVPPGSLFVVGDPKQSIYRFRRADIGTYLGARDRIGRTVRLSANFRSAEPVIEWVNEVFGQLIQPESGSQPEFQPLDPQRAAPPSGPAVTVLGLEAHAGGPSADAVREREAADVAAVVHRAIAERWQVAGKPPDDGDEVWRDVTLGDIAILVPARTSLPHLEAALDAAGIPYRAEASSLVYRTAEVRDLLMAARAADDPSDALALVSALRSPLFGCGDDDLWTWHQAGGHWNLFARPPVDGHPVAEGIAYLRRLHNERTWLAPHQVLTRLAADRRMFEVGALGPRRRDVWRRLRFVIDHSRAWSEAERGSLRDYLAWAARQGEETSRVAEAVLPETDLDTVRIMTVHAAKGLEFPVVVVSGLSSRANGNQSGVQVLWPRDGGCAIKMNKALQTTDFAIAQPIDEQMGHHERLRLLYVACTRARDHLVVSLHRPVRQPQPAEKQTSAELLHSACAGLAGQVAFSTAGRALPALPGTTVAAPEPLSWHDWHERNALARRNSAAPAAVSASDFEGSARSARPAAVTALGEPTDPGLAKNPRDLELPPWNKGRYGTAIGRAVHGVLQTIDLTTGAGLGGAVAAQALAEGVLGEADLIARLAEAALTSPAVRRAAARPHWRETYVGTTVDGRVLDGFIDLVFRDEDGLAVVDYKTDAVPPGALDVRVAFYRPQLAAYALALEAATGEPVARAILVFLSPSGAVDREVTGLRAAIAETAAVVSAFA